MTYIDFVETMKEEVGKTLCETADVEIVDVQKNNGVTKTGLNIRGRDCNISPTIYLEGMYQSYLDGKPEASIVKEIISLYHELNITHIDLEYIQHYDTIKDALGCRLIEKEANKAMLEDIPHIEFLDLALIFFVVVEQKEIGTGSVTINRKMLEYWKIDDEQLKEDAMEICVKNFPPILFDMDTVARGDFASLSHRPPLNEQVIMQKNLIEKNPWNEYLRMLILSNNARNFGASAIVYPGALETIANVFESDFYIIPSSVHEVILLPDVANCNGQELLQLVKCVNSTEVLPEEKLADSVYYYDFKKRELTRI